MSLSPGAIGNSCFSGDPNPCPTKNTYCYTPSGATFGTCLLGVASPCYSDADCIPFQPGLQAFPDFPIQCRLVILTVEGQTANATLDERLESLVLAAAGRPVCTSIYIDNTAFGRCNPNDPNACKSPGPVIEGLTDQPLVCTRLPFNGDHACLGADGSACRVGPAPSGFDLLEDPNNGFCSSGE